MARGSQNGKSNNPKGRPVGAKAKLQLTLKKRIANYLENNFDSYIEDLHCLEAKDRVKAVTELIKLIVPRPVSQEELDAIKGSNSPLLSRLFLKGDEHETSD